MSKVRLLAFTVAALLFGVGSASAVDLNGMKGVGYAQAIGGPAGLSFNFGTGNLIIEGILGLKNLSPDAGDGSLSLGLGLGGHFQALRANEAALTVGVRLNIGLTKNPQITPDGGPDAESITQFGVDIPVRVYWFPNKHISLHTEMGISVVMNPEKGQLWAAQSGAKGMDITVFGDPTGAGAFGNIGMTFWW